MAAQARVTSEVGRLRTVLLHRPGPELSRLTPRNSADLLFDGLPWLARAQEEHDGFAQALRDRGVEVLYLTELLVQALDVPEARAEAVHAAVAPTVVGPALAAVLRTWLLDLDSTTLARVLQAGLTHDELPRTGSRGRRRPAGGRARVRRAAAAEPAVHPRLLGLGRRPRRGHQPVDARAPARDGADRRDLPPPPALRRHPAALRRQPRGGLVRGRRRAAHGARRRRGRRRVSARRRPGSRPSRCAPSPAASPTPCSRSRSRRSGRPCTSTPSARWSTRDAVVMYPNVADTLVGYPVTPDGDDGLVCGDPAPVPRGGRRGDGRRAASARSTPGSTRSPPSASSGTTATTPSPSRPGWSSPTSATPRRTTGWRSPASRSCGSPAASSAAAVAGRAA